LTRGTIWKDEGCYRLDCRQALLAGLAAEGCACETFETRPSSDDSTWTARRTGRVVVRLSSGAINRGVEAGPRRVSLFISGSGIGFIRFSSVAPESAPFWKVLTGAELSADGTPTVDGRVIAPL
jgi:hypothetical protein